MAYVKKPTRGGYPKKIDDAEWEKIEIYMKAGASQERIAKAYGMCNHTFKKIAEERYGKMYHQICEGLRQTGEILIEAKQFQKAMEGNVQLLIWLGKVRLGQRDLDAQAHLAPHQNVIDKEHEIMRLKNEIADLKEKFGVVNADKSEAG